MTRDDLKEILDEHGISPMCYEFRFDFPDCYILIERHGRWIVYYSERGEKVGLQEFATEDKACRNLLEQLLNDKSTRTVVIGNA